MWISPKVFAELAGITYRPAAAAIKRGVWRGQSLRVRQARGRGGAAGVRLEVDLYSLPSKMQASMMLREGSRSGATASLAAATTTHPAREEVGGQTLSQVERELKHEEFVRSPATVQRRAHRAAAVVRAFHAFAGSTLSVKQRYAEVATAAGVSRSSVRAWVKRCARLSPEDWHVALAPRWKSAAPNAPIAPAALGFFEDHYLQLSKPAAKPIILRMRAIAAERGWGTLPSDATFHRLVEKIPLELRILKREGKEAFDRLYSGAPRDYSTLALHQQWGVDGHIANVWVRMENGVVVRPVLIVWQEERTRLFLWVEIALVESAESIARSFGEAAEHARAIPEFVHMDNARGFASKLFTGGAETRYRFKIKDDEPPGVLTLLGIKPKWARPYNAKDKPVESAHRVFTEMAKGFAAMGFPGAYCGSSSDTRPEDADPKKAVPISIFRAVLAETVAAYNARPHRGDSMHGRSPLQMYEELLPHAIVRQPTRAQLRMCLMARKVVKLRKDDHSITVLGNRYWTKDLLALSQARSYVASYNPGDAGHPIALYSRDGARFLVDVPLQEKTGVMSASDAKKRAAGLRLGREAVRDLEAARRQVREAGRWSIPKPSEPAPPVETLPSPKIAQIDTDPRFKRRGRPKVSLADALVANLKNSSGGR